MTFAKKLKEYDHAAENTYIIKHGEKALQPLNKPIKTTIIIPAYNEESTIVSLVESLRSLDFDKEILVVNDGSTDRTAELVRDMDGVRVITHPYNKGNGAAVKTGITSATTENIVVIDADGQHRPEDVAMLIESLGDYDLVVGARTSKSDSGIFRDFGNWVFKRLGGFLANRPVPDMTSGLRAFKKSQIVKFFNLYPNGFSFPTTSTMCFLIAGLSVKFTPITSNRRIMGTSKIRPMKDGAKFIVMIFRIVMFNPLKVFLPVGFFSLLAGVIWSIRTIYLTSSISVGGLLLLVAGINLIFFGFISDQILALRKDLNQRDL